AFALFSPTGRLVLTTANNGRLQLWKTPATPEAASFFRGAYAHGFTRASLGSLGNLNGPPALALFLAAKDDARLPRLWGVDGFEVRYFQSATPSVATCGAFAPDGSVFFTGRADRVVRVWEVPPELQWSEPLEAEITYIGSRVERGTDMVRLRAEMDNPT